MECVIQNTGIFKTPWNFLHINSALGNVYFSCVPVQFYWGQTCMLLQYWFYNELLSQYTIFNAFTRSHLTAASDAWEAVAMETLYLSLRVLWVMLLMSLTIKTDILKSVITKPAISQYFSSCGSIVKLWPGHQSLSGGSKGKRPVWEDLE